MLDNESPENNNIEIDDSDTESDTIEETFNFNNTSKTYASISTNNKKTIPIITKFESARIIGVRIQQLSAGAAPCVKGNYNSILEIAWAEYTSKQIPLIIRRFLPNGSHEDWQIKDFLNI